MSFYGSSGGSGFYKTSSSSSDNKKKSGGLLGLLSKVIPDPIEKVAKTPFEFTGNLLGDVKDAVVGLPTGLVNLATHPIRTAEQVADMTWQTWSPLFHGQIGKFAKQTYDHPLAPILDLATVFTLGAGGAARGASALSKAGIGGERIAKTAALRTPKSIALKDPEPKLVKLRDVEGKVIKDAEGNPVREAVGRPDMYKHMSTRAGRRLVQEGIQSLAEAGRLPNWYTKAQYESAHIVSMAHRAAAKNLMVETILQASRALKDPESGPAMRRELAAGLYTNLRTHAPVKATEQEAARFFSSKSNRQHYQYVLDERYIDEVGRKEYAAAFEQRSKLQENIAKIDSLKERSALAEAQHHELWVRALGQGVQQRSVPYLARRTKNRQKLIEDVLSQPASDLELRKVGMPEIKRGITVGEQELMDLAAVERSLWHRLERQHELAQPRREQAGFGLMEQQAKIVRHESKPLPEHFQTPKYERVKAEGQLRETKAWKDVGDEVTKPFSYAVEEAAFESFAKNLPKYVLTDDITRAARNAEGRVMIVPKHDAKNLGLEAANSHHFLGKLWSRPTMVWKAMVLGFSPRLITNNAVGNWMLYAAREGGADGLIAVRDGLKAMRGEAFTDAVTGAAIPFKRDSWLYREFADEMGNVFSQEARRDIAASGGDLSRPMKAFTDNPVTRTVYGLTKALSEDPVRAAVIAKALRREPGVRKLMDEGYSFERAARKAIEADPMVRERAAFAARQVAGDYQTVRGWERQVRNLMPFYLWNRHVLKTTGNMFLDTPGRLATIQRLSAGGQERAEEILGELPEFLKGAIPLELLGWDSSTPSRANVLLTSSLNPFATVGEIADTVKAVTVGGTERPGAAIFGSANPLLTGSIEYATGTSLLTGAPKPSHGGLVSSIMENFINNAPLSRTAEELLTPDTTVSPSGRELLYGKSDITALMSMLGIPVRSVSEEQLATRAKSAKGGTTRRRTSGFYG